MGFSEGELEYLLDLLKRREDVIEQERGIQAITQSPRNWRKRDILRQAREWGWEIVHRRARHHTQAVLGNLRVSIPGHGDGDSLGAGIAHKVLKELAEPKLRELQLQRQDYSDLLVSFLLSRDISFNSLLESGLLIEQIESLEEQNLKLELKIVETEEVALSLLTEKELENQRLANRIRELAEEQLRVQETVNRAILDLKRLKHLFDQLQNVVDHIPIPGVRSLLQSYLNKIMSIFETNLPSASSRKLLPENEQDIYYQEKLPLEDNHGSHRES